MTSSIRDITFLLRQGQFIALADETGWSVAADPISDAAVETLLGLQTLLPPAVRPTVLIQNTDQLGMYVAKVPDVAFDLIEFAENPLTVVYDQGKNVSLALWPKITGAATGEIAVRRSLTVDVQQLLGGFGRGLLTIPFESLTLPTEAESLVAVGTVNCPPASGSRASCS